MLAGTVDLRLPGLTKLLGSLKGACKVETHVGIFEEATYPDGTAVAYVGYLNEYGGHNPPRPFLRRTQEKQFNKWLGIYTNVLKGGISAANIDKAHNQIGIVASQDVKITIKQWNPSDPRMNKPATIRAKARKSAGAKGKNQAGNNPIRVLHDTGVMINSITYKVEQKK